MAGNQQAQPGHSIVTTTFIELAGVAIMAILAGMSDNLGRIVLIVMWGFLLGWFLLNTSELKKLVSAI